MRLFLTDKLYFAGANKLILIGGSQIETDLVRNVIKSRWPYPISRDGELFLDEKNKAWLFKLKRQPWAVSYGNKKFDRAVEIAQTLLRKSISPPKNTDSESGKSVLVFLLKVKKYFFLFFFLSYLFQILF